MVERLPGAAQLDQSDTRPRRRPVHGLGEVVGRHPARARGLHEHAAGDPDIYLFTDLDGVGDTAVNAFQRASDVVVQKSLREGFGLVVAEGMWKGKPVVGGDVGGIRLQIEEGVTGYLVDGIVACADRVTQLLLDPELRRAIGEAGRERARDRFLSLRELEDTFRLITDLERGE